MRIKYELVRRRIAGETFLVPIGEGAKKFNGMFALNELGDFLWERIPGAETAQSLVEQVVAEYEVSPEEAAADTAEFLTKLSEMGILEM